MSSKSTEKVRCPYCKKRQDFIKWDSVNTLVNPELRNKVLDTSIFINRCIRCKANIVLEYPLIYHDQREKFMVWLIPSDEDDQPPKIPQGEYTLPGYRMRVVKTIYRLVEKILILEHKFDDQGIEILKDAIWQGGLKAEGVELKNLYFYDGIINQRETSITFYYIDKNKKVEFIRKSEKNSDTPVLANFMMDRNQTPGWQWNDFNYPLLFMEKH